MCSKICKFVSLYWSPSETSDDFEKFTDNLELTLGNVAESNSDWIVVLGDLNIKSKNWHINDKTATKSAKICYFTIRTPSDEKWTNTCFREFLVLYWSHFHIRTKLGGRFRCSSIFTPKLPLSNCVCKIQLENSFSPTLRTINMALWKREYWIY